MAKAGTIYKVRGQFYIAKPIPPEDSCSGVCPTHCALNDLDCRPCGGCYYVPYVGPEPEVVLVEVRQDYDGTAPADTAGKRATSWILLPEGEYKWALMMPGRANELYYRERELHITYKQGESKMGKEWFRVKTKEEMAGMDLTESSGFTPPMQKHTFGAIPYKITGKDDPRMILHFKLPDGTTDYWRYRPEWLVPIHVEEQEVTTTKVISPASKLMKILEESGFEFERGHFRNPKDGQVFNPKMFAYCGQDPKGIRYVWANEWVETTTEKQLVEVAAPEARKVPFRQFLQEWMILKQEHTIPEYLTSRDLLQLSMLGDEGLKYAEAILKSIRRKLGEREERVTFFQGSVCPFCLIADAECKVCAYGKRHGICTKGDSSDFHNAVRTLESKDSEEFKETVRQFVDNIELV